MKMLDATPSDSLALTKGQSLEMSAGDGVWRVTSGMLLIGDPARPDQPPWRLALPGDWLNLESVCGLPTDFQVSTLMSGALQAVPAAQGEAASRLLHRMVRQQQQWARNLLALRTGPVERRIEHVLALAGQARGRLSWDASAQELPLLRDIAALVDAAPATACRALAKWRSARQTVPTARVRQATPALAAAPAGF